MFVCHVVLGRRDGDEIVYDLPVGPTVAIEFGTFGGSQMQLCDRDRVSHLGDRLEYLVVVRDSIFNPHFLTVPSSCGVRRLSVSVSQERLEPVRASAMLERYGVDHPGAEVQVMYSSRWWDDHDVD